MSTRLGLLLLLVASAAGSSHAATAGAPLPQRVQRLAVLDVAETAWAAPRAGSASVMIVASRRPITGERTTLPVVAATTAGGVKWLDVRLPGRPNGRTAWIRARGTVARVTRWHLVVALAARTVTAYRGGVAVRTFGAVVGKSSTPTPTGEFFVEEAVALPPGAVGAPYALALSARSEVLREFDGGPGQIALHGLANVGGTLGTAASHGCVRLSGTAMGWLVRHVGPGVPVSIR